MKDQIIMENMVQIMNAAFSRSLTCHPKWVCERLLINWRAEKVWFCFQAINIFQVQKDLQDLNNLFASN